MRQRFTWHRTMTIALAVAFVCAVIVHEREVTLLTSPGSTHAFALSWLAVVAAGALCFVCGASFAAALRRARPHEPQIEERT